MLSGILFKAHEFFNKMPDLYINGGLIASALALTWLAIAVDNKVTKSVVLAYVVLP